MQLNKNAIYRCATTQDNSGLCTGLDDPFRGSDMPICVMGLCCLTQLRPNTLSDYRTMSLTSWTKPRSLTWEFTVLTTKPMLSHRQLVTQQSNSLFTVGNTTAVLLAFCTNKSNEVKNKWSTIHGNVIETSQTTTINRVHRITTAEQTDGKVQWRNYERRSEAIASGRQAAGGALGQWVVCFTAEFLKTEGR